MNITVVGLGKIGESIIKNVAKEDHNIVAVDTNFELVNGLIEKYDINGVAGNGASYEIQKTAGVDKADIFIAVTSTDELNIMACMLAKNMGAAFTIARVRNPEYSEQVEMMKGKLGIDMILNPEYEAACEVERVISLPDALKIDTFSNGKIYLAESVIEENSHLTGLSLAEVRAKIGVQILVGAVIRDGEVIIPTGNFRFEIGDRVHLVAKPEDLSAFYNSLGLLHEFIHNIMIIGGGKISYYLAKLCDSKKYKIKIFEQNYAVCERLNEQLPNAVIVHGDGTDQDTLHSEGFEEADACFALTGNDEENIVLSFYAHKVGIPKIFAKVNRDGLTSLLGEGSTTSIISPRNLVANQIVSFIRALSNAKGSNVSTLYKLQDDRIEALEFAVKDNFKALKVALKDLHLKPNVLVAAIIRDGEALIPGGNDEIRSKDEVLIVTTNTQFDDLNDILAE